MPLITKHTNLKSIKFGVGSASDRPGGGYSNQPYIIKDIPSNTSDPSNVFNTGGPDSLLRGGLMAPIKAIDDVSRLTQMFFDTRSPNGLLFTVKQNVLSRTSVKTEASIGAGTAWGAVNQGVYLPTSTIAQSLVGFTGIHGNLLGVNPLSPTKSNDSLSSQKGNLGLVKYETAALYNSRETNNTFTTDIKYNPYTQFPIINNITGGDTQPIIPLYTSLPIVGTSNFSNRLLDIWDTKQSVKNDDPNIITYGGGPGSILGIGKTKIPFTNVRTGANNPLSITDPAFFNGVGNGRNEDIVRDVSGKLNGVSHVSSILLPNSEDRAGLKDFNEDINSTQTLNDQHYTLGVTGRSKEEIENATGQRNQNIPRHITTQLDGASLQSTLLLPNEEDREDLNFYTSLQKSYIGLNKQYLVLGDSGRSNEEIAYSVGQRIPYISRNLDGKLEGVSSISSNLDLLNKLNPNITSETDISEISGSTIPNRVTANESQTGLHNPLATTDPNYFYGTGDRRNQDTPRSMENRGRKFYGASSAGEESGIEGLRIIGNENTIDRISGTSYVLGSGGRNSNEIGLALGVTSDGRVPRTEYATVLVSGASNKYNTLVSNISNGEQIDNEGFLQGNSFNVYNPLVGDSLWPTNSRLQSFNNSSTYTQTQIIEEGRNDGKLTGQPLIKDFRKTLIDGGSTNTLLTLSPGYNTPKAIDSRVHRGNPGTKNSTNNYTQGNPQALDMINASGFFDGAAPTLNPNREDLIKFSIGILKNDGSGESTYMHFRSFINSFSDTFSSEWGDVQYIGRGDKFHNYKGYSRSISMDWTCYAQSKQELIPMYKKLNFLASSLAPDYSTTGFMRGNLARLTVGGYLYNQLGIIKSLTYTVPQESTWEIGLDALGGYDSEVKELPHMINVTGFSFTPIENRVPQKGSRFISLSTGAGNNSTNYTPGSYT